MDKYTNVATKAVIWLVLIFLVGLIVWFGLNYYNNVLSPDHVARYGSLILGL